MRVVAFLCVTCIVSGICIYPLVVFFVNQIKEKDNNMSVIAIYYRDYMAIY